MNSLAQINKEIKEKDNFILMGHIDPDGDCIGSLFALKWYLDYLQKKSLVLLNDHPKEKYDYLAIDTDDYSLFDNFKTAELNWSDLNYIALDSGDIERLGKGKKLVDEHFLINIDHHVDNPEYGNINYINSKTAATGEILYDLFRLDHKRLNKKISTALATAVIADTGAMRYQNTTAKIFNMMADFEKRGIKIYQIIKSIFGSYSYKSVKLKGLVLSTLELSSDKKIAWLKVEKSFLEKTNTDSKNTSGLVNYARDIKGVEVGIVFIEAEDNSIKVGLRSNNYCPVNKIAAYFDGGGHERAAGCIVTDSLDKAVKKVINKVENYV